MFHSLVYQPIYNLLIFLYSILWSDLGLAIIVLTILIKFLLIPLSKKQIESQKELQKVQPKIKEIQEKYKNDHQKKSEEMLKLYKEHKINPASGCLPLVIQIVIFVAINMIVKDLVEADDFKVNLNNLYSFIPYKENINHMFLSFLDLSKTKNYYLATITAFFQFYQIKMMQKSAEKKESLSKNLSKTESGLNPDMAEIMNKQMTIIVPVTVFISCVGFPSAMALYWLTSTIFSIIQQQIVLNKKESEINN